MGTMSDLLETIARQDNLDLQGMDSLLQTFQHLGENQSAGADWDHDIRVSRHVLSQSRTMLDFLATVKALLPPSPSELQPTPGPSSQKGPAPRSLQSLFSRSPAALERASSESSPESRQEGQPAVQPPQPGSGAAQPPEAPQPPRRRPAGTLVGSLPRSRGRRRTPTR
jgi:hypothetical protein